jgi:hypothetical protein
MFSWQPFVCDSRFLLIDDQRFQQRSLFVLECVYSCSRRCAWGGVCISDFPVSLHDSRLANFMKYMSLEFRLTGNIDVYFVVILNRLKFCCVLPKQPFTFWVMFRCQPRTQYLVVFLIKSAAHDRQVILLQEVCAVTSPSKYSNKIRFHWKHFKLLMQLTFHCRQLVYQRVFISHNVVVKWQRSAPVDQDLHPHFVQTICIAPKQFCLNFGIWNTELLEAHVLYFEGTISSLHRFNRKLMQKLMLMFRWTSIAAVLRYRKVEAW